MIKLLHKHCTKLKINQSINGIIISIWPDPELLISSIIRVYHPPLARVVVE